ncbi:MAG TPA: hypothetical protein VHB79_32135 [Polyangiaceae bacterium]|nr:hypothetical protein [Polyangiaceae bacterium]
MKAILLSCIVAAWGLVACGGDVEVKDPHDEHADDHAEHAADRAADKADEAAEKAKDAADDAKHD